jgi:signal transduction histidine kinase/CheY-like chemotaxis protein
MSHPYRLNISLLLVLCLISLLGPHPAFAQKSSEKPVAIKGLLDLRNADLSKQTLPLSGEWGIYWQKLISPESPPNGPVNFVPFPELWTKTKLNGYTLPSKGFASYTLTVLLPPHHNKLALEVPDTYSCYRLYVNNEIFAVSGSPDSIEARARPRWVENTIELTGKQDTLHLILQVANYWHSKGGPYKDILIGDKNALFHEKEIDNAFDLFLTGCLFMGGLFFFGLFLFGRHDKSILYFALFCMSYSYRIIGSRGYVLHSIFPDIPWTITTHLEYLSLFISVVFFSLYTKHLYPLDSNKIAVRLEVWSCLALSAIVILFPPAVFTKLINPFLVVMFGVLAYAFYVYIVAMRNKRLGAQYALMSTGVVFLVFFVINLQYFGILAPQKGILFAGYLSFFFLQSLVLSFRFAYTLKKAKEEAEQGLKAKNEFLSTMSHEIRTPLNSILGMTHLILRDKPSPQQKEQLDVLLFSANNLLSIVNDILDYNKIEAGKINFEKIETDLPMICRNIFSGMQSSAEKNIAFHLQIDPELKNKILTDPTRISQVISNLVSNAIKFTRQGQVSLEVKVEKQDETSITLRISIKDTGIGIAPEKQKLIFEQFTQADASTSRNYGGTGLGLAICKKLLELQGSALHLKSELNKGSEFYFTQTFTKILHTEKNIPDAQEKATIEDSKPLTGTWILLVEDNEVNILVAKTFLERWGASIDIAMNGREALDKLDVSKHKLILMDMHMPVMDGYDATRIMREKGVTLPIIALTASLAHEIVEKVNDIGVDDIVVKPFVPDELLKLILLHTQNQKSTS